MYQLTPEQLAIRGIRGGVNVIAANAGTGKTESLSDLMVLSYLREEKELFLNLTAHVSADDQRKLLGQFMAVTFTRAAAAEFNDRVSRRFRDEDIPLPLDRFGRPWRFCRTLDSYIRGWFHRRAVFDAWMETDPDFSQAIDHAIATLSPAVRTSLLEAQSQRFGFHLHWQWLPPAGVEDMIMDVIIRDAEQLPSVPDLPPFAQWEGDWQTWLGTYIPPLKRDGQQPSPIENFWRPKLAIFEAYQHSMREKKQLYHEGHYLADPNFKQLVEEIHLWERIQVTKQEFATIHTLARSRGYHPLRWKDRMMTLGLLQELAASNYVFAFDQFHQLATRLYAAKLLFLFADHVDFSNFFVELATSRPYLLERGREYPALGIRTKYTFFDEAQDLSYFQIRLVNLWKPNDGVPFCIVLVGDVAQAIYAWRGASTYGFAGIIERVRAETPEKLFHLTCSFRSLTSIVELGNTIAASLPQFKDTRHPSVTIYAQPGKVEVLPPCVDLAAGAELVCTRIAQILATTQDTVMVLYRNNYDNHPILPRLQAFGEPRLRWMTIHRAKGLEADHVFVIDLTSGVIPDVRGSFVQEINLFYVACTRPRKALYLCAPFTRPAIDRNTGLLFEEEIGPSSFFARIKVLAEKADAAGWPTDMVARGEANMERGLRALQARTEVRAVHLRQWWAANYPHIPLRHTDDERPRSEAGSALAPAEIRNLPKISIWDSSTPLQTLTSTTAFLAANDPGADKRKDDLFEKLRDKYLRSGVVPRLRHDQFVIALHANWIFTKSGAGCFFTQAFTRLARQAPAKPAA